MPFDRQIAACELCGYGDGMGTTGGQFTAKVEMPGSTADQTSLPFVNQDVGDDGRFCRLQFTALCAVCGFQLLKLLSARWVKSAQY
jgi:hypothetical protein